jgi:hypothetical protein
MCTFLKPGEEYRTGDGQLLVRQSVVCLVSCCLALASSSFLYIAWFDCEDRRALASDNVTVTVRGGTKTTGTGSMYLTVYES